MSDQHPAPGSREAIKRGCTCAILDNNHAQHPPRPPDGWWITAGCPLHAPRERDPEGSRPK